MPHFMVIMTPGDFILAAFLGLILAVALLIVVAEWYWRLKKWLSGKIGF